MEYTSKNFDSTYLYSKGNYEKPLLETIIGCNRIDKHSKEFEEVIIDVKRRQETSILVEVLKSDKVILFLDKATPNAFSVFTARDPKNNREQRVFVDCNNIIEFKNGYYVCRRPDVLVAYLMSAMNHVIYYADPKRILTNTELTITGTECFVSLFSYILDYLRISGFSQNKSKVQYLSAIYYQTVILNKPLDTSTKNIAIRVSKLTGREAELSDLLYDEERDLVNIKTFIDRIAEVFSFKGLTVDVFVERWRYLFGRGTQFGCELYTSFASMITNAYSGAYINQQKTIEKCVGRDMVVFTTCLMGIGSQSIIKPSY